VPKLRTLLAAVAALLALTGALAPAAHAQATRTWVSGVGDDVNPCSRTAPCKTFAGTISKTAEGGEINAIDPGGFGTLSVTKGITVDGTGVLAGVLNSSTNGFIVNAPNADVVLRGLDIDGGNPLSGSCAYGGVDGVKVIAARSVRIEHSSITHQAKAIELLPGATNTSVFVNDVDISDNCAGIVAGGSASLNVHASTITNSGVALSVADGTTAWLSSTTIFGNALGLQTTGTGVLNDFGDNRVAGNTVDGTATTSLVAPPVAGPAGPAGPAGAPGTAGVAGPAGEPAIKLLVAASASKLVAKPGARVELGYASTTGGASTLVVSRAGKTVATVHGSAKAGANEIAWNGRGGKAGAYRLSLRVLGADGQTGVTGAALTVKRR